MTLTQMIELLRQRLGNRSQLDTQIVQEINFVQAVAERAPSLPWFLRAITTFAASTASVSCPTGFLRLATMDECLWVVTDEGEDLALAKDDYGYLRRQDDLQGSAQPEAFALVGSKFYFFPTPDKEYTFKLDSFTADSTLVLSSAETNLWSTHAPYVLISKAGKALALALRSVEVYEQFALMEKEAERLLVIENVARDQAGDPVSLRN